MSLLKINEEDNFAEILRMEWSSKSTSSNKSYGQSAFSFMLVRKAPGQEGTEPGLAVLEKVFMVFGLCD